MEITIGPVHTAFPMRDASRVGEARRHASTLAQQAGLDEVESGRLALVVTELGSNLVRHAQDGVLLLAGQPACVEVLAIDRGPGIADLHQSLGDGYSTGGTPGTGLGAVRRLADDFDMYSQLPGGTVVLARIRGAAQPPPPAHGFRVGAVVLPIADEQSSGDAWALAANGTQARLLVADGLGHGPDAAAASAEAVAAFSESLHLPIGGQLEQVHQRLRSTRGAAVSIYELSPQADRVTHVSAGNVLARLVSGTSEKVLLGQHGTAGVAMRRPQPVQVVWAEHALLVAHSDGIESRWPGGLLSPVLQHDPTLAAAVLWRAHSRGRDDACVVVVSRKGAA